MKILVFVREFAAPTLTFVYNDVCALAETEVVKIVTTVRSNKERFSFPDVSVFPLHRIPFIAKQIRSIQDADWTIGYKSFAIKKGIRYLMDSFKPDVINLQFGGQSWIFLENWPESEVPIFVTMHGYDASMKLRSSRYVKQCKKYFARKDVSVVFVSNEMSDRVEAVVGPIERKHTVYCGIDTDFFQPKRPQGSGRQFTFLQVSSFSAKKGHEFTIKSFAQLLSDPSQRGKVQLVLAGNGPLKQKCIELVASLGISEYVHFPGLVNARECQELMNQSHMFVHHSVTPYESGDKEGIPTAIMEAMAMELPILSSFHSGIPELVEDGVNGILVPERDIEAYTNGMKSILGWSYLPKNREKVIDLFDKKKRKSILLDLYRSHLPKGHIDL